MYGKEDERQVVTTRDIQKTLRTQLNYNLPVLIIGVIFSLITIPFIFTLLAETIDTVGTYWFVPTLLYFIGYTALVLLFAFFTVHNIIWFVREHNIIRYGDFAVVEDTVDRVGPADTERFTYSPFIRRRDVYWNSGDYMSQREGNVVGKYFNRRFVYPVDFSKYGRAIYDTFKWKNYISDGDKCILVIYDENYYPGDCNIVRIYPSKMYRYKE